MRRKRSIALIRSKFLRLAVLVLSGAEPASSLKEGEKLLAASLSDLTPLSKRLPLHYNLMSARSQYYMTTDALHLAKGEFAESLKVW